MMQYLKIEEETSVILTKKNAEKDLTFRNDWAFWWFGNIIILPKICCSVALVTGTFPLYFWRVLIQRFISETKSFTPNSASLSSTRRVQRSILDLRSIFRQTYDLASASSSATFLTRWCTIQKLWGLSNEILYICVAIGAVKLLEVKVGGLRKLPNVCLTAHP